MYSLAEIKTGIAVVIDGDPYVILRSQFSKQGRQGGVTSTKMKNLKTGSTIQKTFQGNDKLEPADVGYRHVQYLYGDGENFTFMNLDSYDQFSLSSSEVGEDGQKYLVDGMEMDVLTYEEKAIGVKFPVTVDLKVESTTPGVKGDTAQGGTKPATLESGAVIQVPLFVNEGETVRVNTERGEYVERVS
ncbi:elongation factor P [Candidatus Peribacteria bacterium]|jgi:elongation factor P|nr:elongation factor P [Candidatus Peribacteria bacterium]MBT4020992.1 elongation factor P [Candidatus Peribacteria bacterium]MBT4240891.1 elongation factor P [Candidatus Peribacteria bacterium]MBT4474114.1 elongation factor P [Candidatus Peribacteria bacterium]